MGDRSSLPKWAQREFQTMEADLRRAKKALAAGPEDSDTFADPYIENRPLGNHEQIRFVVSLRQDGSPLDYFDVRLADEHENQGAVLRVSGSERIAVEPQSSNLVAVRVANR